MKKRLLGINCILKALTKLNEFYPVLSKDVASNISALISKNLLINDNNILSLLFNDPNIHEQLLFKGKEVLSELAKLKVLDDKDIERIYNLTLVHSIDSEFYKDLYKILCKLIENISLNQLKTLFNKIILFPYEQIKEEDIFCCRLFLTK